MGLSPRVQDWRNAGKHLPKFLRDFHDQKAVFKTMHEMLGEQTAEEKARFDRPNWLVGHIYIIDCFLWFMARHGYTLQRTRTKNLEFDDLKANIDAITAKRTSQLQAMLLAAAKPSADKAQAN